MLSPSHSSVGPGGMSRVRLRRVRARRQGGVGGRGDRAGGVRAPHGHQPRVLLPPRPARATSPPRRGSGSGRRQQRGEPLGVASSSVSSRK